MNNNTGIHASFKLQLASKNEETFELDVDLCLPAKGISVIFGHSGSGKTTLLRCLAGLEKADHGELIVNDEVWQDAENFTPPHQRPIGYVFQESSLFPHLTALKNLNYAIKRARRPFNKSLYTRVISVMGIEGIFNRYPYQLSGGERQRVAIARALLIQPQLLLMDEPLASLDASRKQEILPYIEKLPSRFNIPIVYVSHSMNEVTRLADHTVVLGQGNIIAQGEPSAIFSRLDLSMGFQDDLGVILSGTISERDTQWHLARVAFADSTMWIRDDGDTIGQTIRVRILAKDVSLTLAPHSDSSIQNILPVEVVEIAKDSDTAMSLIRLKMGREFLIARITSRATTQLRLVPGKQAWAQIKSVAIVK